MRQRARPATRRSYAVWELTLACNLACQHCGSRAGHARPSELTTDEALGLVVQLADIGIDEVTLIGGEAFLRGDWLVIAEAIGRAGMTCTVTTGGYRLSALTALRMRMAGIQQCSVSVDGLDATHDRLRGRLGSFQSCLATFERLRAADIRIVCNTQINRLSAPELVPLYKILLAVGVEAWQLQLTVPMGGAADNAELLLQPAELLNVFPVLGDLASRGRRDGMRVYGANNVGYFGPFERLLRSPDGETFWTGCQAGLSTLGIEADGTIKGCPSLPTASYAGGNIRDRPLAEIVGSADQLQINITAEGGAATDDLWGFCATCDYAAVCRGGCSWTAHTFFGRTGNNPYCHHRALTLASRGIRERAIRVVAAPGRPFDHGLFELVEEPVDAPWPADDTLHKAVTELP